MPARNSGGSERFIDDKDLILIDGVRADQFDPGMASATRARRSRLLTWLGAHAATIALAAGIGASVGALLSSGIDNKAEIAVADSVESEPTVALQARVSQIATELASLKATVKADDAGAAAGAAQAAGTKPLRPAQPRRVAGFEPRKNTISKEITGSVKPPVQTQPVARDWTLWRVTNGRALVEARGAYYLVVPGSTLPRLGKVQRITRRDGRWVVQTRNGLILQRG